MPLWTVLPIHKDCCITNRSGSRKLPAVPENYLHMHGLDGRLFPGRKAVSLSIYHLDVDSVRVIRFSVLLAHVRKSPFLFFICPLKEP